MRLARMNVKLPHEAPVRMISSLEQADSASCACKAYIPADSPYVCDGILLPEMFVEIMAQCFAAGAVCKGGEAKGFLAGVTSFEVEDMARGNETLTVYCRILRQIGSVSLIAGEVFNHENRRMAAAEFRIFIEDSE